MLDRIEQRVAPRFVPVQGAPRRRSAMPAVVIAGCVLGAAVMTVLAWVTR